MADRPNIVFLISDDTSEAMLGYSGGEVLTPTIDGIARDGVRADAHHTCTAICAPSRFAYLTGLYPGRSTAPAFRAAHRRGEPRCVWFNTDLLPDAPVTVAAMLREAGYRTGYVGKWHCGPRQEDLGVPDFDEDDDPADPDVDRRLKRHQEMVCEQVRRNGFDAAHSISWGNPHPPERRVRKLRHHNLEWITHGALRFLDDAARDGRPFYLHVATSTIHGPGHVESLLADPRLTAAGRVEDHLGCQAPRASIYERLQDAGLPFTHVTAGALWMDDAFGALLRRLGELGLDENTLVIYTVDHGNVDGKFTCYQRGVRVPFVARWPGRIPPGRRTDALTQNVDLAPTLLAAAGAAPPDGAAFDGVNVLPSLCGTDAPAAPREDLYFELGYARAVRTDRWKYIACRLPDRLIEQMKRGEVDAALGPNGKTPHALIVHGYPHFFDPDQLYDLRSDPHEQRNLAGDPACASVLAEMRGRLRRHLDGMDGPFDLDRVDPFYESEAIRRLTAGLDDLGRLAGKDWWDRKWF